MELTCEKCGGPATKYPGGISRKTRKPYNARIQCENPDCGGVKWLQAPKYPQAQQTFPRANVGVADPSQQEILNRLAVRLENIDLYLKRLAEDYDALATFFRTFQNKGESLVEGEGGLEGVGVRVSERFYKQGVSPPPNNPEQS